MWMNLCMYTVMAFVLCVGVARADERDEILEAVDAVAVAWNAGDVDAIQEHYAPDFTRYSSGGDSLGGVWNWAGMRRWFESGAKTAVSVDDPQATVYGNTAIVTAYKTVTITRPDSTSETTTRRATTVWVKLEGQWKEVHSHTSLLMPQQTE
jgi:uncharacterized protein (TIGR02246 family)